MTNLSGRVTAPSSGISWRVIRRKSVVFPTPFRADQSNPLARVYMKCGVLEQIAFALEFRDFTESDHVCVSCAEERATKGPAGPKGAMKAHDGGGVRLICLEGLEAAPRSPIAETCWGDGERPRTPWLEVEPRSLIAATPHAEQFGEIEARRHCINVPFYRGARPEGA